MIQNLSSVAQAEGVEESRLRRLVGIGHTTIVKNARRDIPALGIGEGLSTKINANIGTSPLTTDLDFELEKARVAVEAGAHTVMDLSTGAGIDETRRAILKAIDVPVGTVPVYQAFAEKRFDMTPEALLHVIEAQCKDGVDFITVHCGIRLEQARRLSKKTRIIPVTSRGGSVLAAWMLKTGQENPLYAEYDALLEIAKEYDVVLSLGDALRPGSLLDANDYFQNSELETLGELTKRARQAGVQVIIEGPGHMPLDTIVDNVKYQKLVCDGAPYYVLGPLVTDTALGYDHISGAIGGAIAAAAGVDFLCYVTPAEHVGLPDVEDVEKGVIASKIAAHAADIVKLGGKARCEDERISRARGVLDWHTMEKYALDKKTRARIEKAKNDEPCTMCGDLCALKVCDDLIDKEDPKDDGA